jgi:hypothetical protein
MSLNNLQPSWLFFIENTLDKVENNTISYEEACEIIRKNPEVPEDIRIAYGYKKRGRPPKDA